MLKSKLEHFVCFDFGGEGVYTSTKEKLPCFFPPISLECYVFRCLHACMTTCRNYMQHIINVYKPHDKNT